MPLRYSRQRNRRMNWFILTKMRLLEKEYGMLEELEGKPFPLPVLFIRDETWVYSLRQYIEGRTFGWNLFFVFQKRLVIL